MKHISLQEAFGEHRAWGPTVLPHPHWAAVHLATADAKIKDPVSALLKWLLLKKFQERMHYCHLEEPNSVLKSFILFQSVLF